MILLTGFEPFGGDATNPSWTAATLARDILRNEGLQVEAIELPCVFGDAATKLVEAIDRLNPALVISLGLAGGRDRISLERVAINCDDARIPDNAGRRPIDEEVVPGGPAAYFSTLPVKAALRALQIAGIRAEVSQTAGTYVCNHVFYALMNALAKRPQTRGGFVHVPYDDSELRPATVLAGSAISAMPAKTMAEGIAVVVRTALVTDADLTLSAGAIH